MTVWVRFAPSPTGLLHVGNARVALLNWLFAKAHGGYFLLRMDDTDLERSRPEFAEAIKEDLHWLGLDWDKKIRQSDRQAAYDSAIEKLKAAGRLYACYETPEELEYKRKRQMGRGKPPVYDREGLNLTDAQRQAYEAEGRKPHWRFLLKSEDIFWDDLARGECRYHADHLSDPVLIRADGTPLYTLPSVVDDIDMKITHVIRGEDHVTNTAAQIQVFRALGAEPPAFAHLPLLADVSGGKLSKRLGSGSLRDLREGGIEPMAINSLLARLGTAESGLAHSLDQLLEGFDIGKFGRATPKFDPAELEVLTGRLIHDMDFDAAKPRLDALGLADMDRDFWNAVRANLSGFEEAREWWQICKTPVQPVTEDEDFTRQAAELLPPEPWDENTWSDFAGRVKEATGRKGKELFMPLRKALTGLEHGPELKVLLPLLGRKRAQARLLGEKA